MARLPSSGMCRVIQFAGACSHPPLIVPANGSKMRVDSSEANRRWVVLAKPGADYQMEFTFERRLDRCWELTRYEDQSL